VRAGCGAEGAAGGDADAACGLAEDGAGVGGGGAFVVGAGACVERAGVCDEDGGACDDAAGAFEEVTAAGAVAGVCVGVAGVCGAAAGGRPGAGWRAAARATGFCAGGARRKMTAVRPTNPIAIAAAAYPSILVSGAFRTDALRGGASVASTESARALRPCASAATRSSLDLRRSESRIRLTGDRSPYRS
jgi:hypothetical protein